MRRTDSAMDTTESFRAQRPNDSSNHTNALELTVLGVCCGNGLNRLNCALVYYRQAAPNAPLQMELLQHSELDVSLTVRIPILNLLSKVSSKPSLASRLNAQLGRMFSNGITTFCKIHNITLDSIDLVGTHIPALRRSRLPEADVSSTHPLGWNAVLALEAGLTVASGFTVLESGASEPHTSPVAFVDGLLLRHPSKFRACLNIDELVDLSFIPPSTDSGAHITRSRTCGPGSLFIDYAMRYYTSNERGEDYNGAFAPEGKVNQKIVDRFLQGHDYLRVSPPLSIAREMFGDHEAQYLIDECLFLSMSDKDAVATMTRITTQNILNQYRRLLSLFFPAEQKVDELFICGPSVKNANIIDYLETELPESVITKPLDDIGIQGDANQAVCYAHLALETLLGRATRSSDPSQAPAAPTDHDTVKGNIFCGTDWEETMERVLQFSNGKPLHVTRDIRVTGSLETALSGLKLQ